MPAPGRPGNDRDHPRHARRSPDRIESPRSSVYALDEVAAEAPRFREAVIRREGFRPLYLKVKLLYGCNLRCQMCNHWREARPGQLTTARLREVLALLAALYGQLERAAPGA